MPDREDSDAAAGPPPTAHKSASHAGALSAAPRQRIFINGKFLSAPATGVQRVACEIVRALDRVLESRASRDGGRRWILLTPPGARRLELAHIEQSTVGFVSGLIWEQAVLPFAARSGALVNFCNVAPLFHHKNILTIHDAQVYQAQSSYRWAFRAWYRFLQPRVARRSALLATVSAFSKQELASFGVDANERIQVVHNGVDHIMHAAPDGKILQQHDLAPQRYFLAFASPQPHKNVDMIIRAFLAADAPGYKLVLIGRPTTSAVTRPRSIVYVGGVDDPSLHALYAGAAAFLFPSLTEGFGLPPGEALCCSCPAIISNRGALREIYAGTAPMLDPADEAAWTEAISTLANEPSRRAELAKRGEALARRLTWQRAAETYLALINEALKDGA